MLVSINSLTRSDEYLQLMLKQDYCYVIWMLCQKL